MINISIKTFQNIKSMIHCLIVHNAKAPECFFWHKFMKIRSLRHWKWPFEYPQKNATSLEMAVPRALNLLLLVISQLLDCVYLCVLLSWWHMLTVEPISWKGCGRVPILTTFCILGSYRVGKVTLISVFF